MKHILSLAFAALSLPAQAEILTFSMPDEIAGTETYVAVLRAENYRRVAWENAIWITCHPSGNATAEWKNGGRYSGWSVGPLEVVTAKFDDEQPIDMTVRSLAAGPFFEKVRSSHRLIVRRSGAATTSSFDLKGSASALTQIAKQCGA